jgi:hypothetical protein
VALPGEALGMRRAAPLCLLALLVMAQSTHAQQTVSTAADVPPGPGTIRGRVVHREDSQRPLEGVALTLYALAPTGLAGMRHGVSDADGRFSFEGVANDPATPYLIGAEYQGVPYSGARVTFPPETLEREVEIRVAEVTGETQNLSVPLVRLRIDWLGARLQVVESLTIRNGSPRTIYVPLEARSTGSPALRAQLPAGAEGFLMPHGRQPEGVEHRDGKVAFWGPVYPGEQDLSFSYLIPASGERAEIDLAFPSGTERIEVRVPVGGPTPSGERLVEKESETLKGRSFRIFEGPALAPGERLALSLDLPPARVDPDSFNVAEARLVLTLDDAALAVRETHVLKVEGETGLTPAPGESLLQISLPAASQNVHFASDAAGLSVERLPEGGLDVGGVAPPGESTVAVDYRIPVSSSSVDLIRSFEQRVPLLSVYLADTGRLIPESDRLHRRRPARTGDLTYIHLEAFNVAPGEEVALRISTRPPSRGSSPGRVMAFVVLAGLLSSALMIAPLLGGDLGLEDAETEELPSVRERESIYAAIGDLEHDHETGKISEADYATMRDELRSRAVNLLRRERENPVDAEASEAVPRCTACGGEVKATDRFCSQCGQAIAGSPKEEPKG